MAPWLIPILGNVIPSMLGGIFNPGASAIGSSPSGQSNQAAQAAAAAQVAAAEAEAQAQAEQARNKTMLTTVLTWLGIIMASVAAVWGAVKLLTPKPTRARWSTRRRTRR